MAWGWWQSLPAPSQPYLRATAPFRVPFSRGRGETARLRPIREMEIVTWRNRTAATVDLNETWLCPQIEVLETDHPERRFVCAMCLYAQDVVTGVLPGPYTQEDAERFARSFLAPDSAFFDTS